MLQVSPDVDTIIVEKHKNDSGFHQRDFGNTGTQSYTKNAKYFEIRAKKRDRGPGSAITVYTFVLSAADQDNDSFYPGTWYQIGCTVVSCVSLYLVGVLSCEVLEGVIQFGGLMGA